MFLIVGLGNPGKEYDNTRHNIGFKVIDSIHQNYNFNTPRTKFQSELSDGLVDGHKIWLQKPLNYMNRSGGPVLQAANFLKIPIENIIVIHDDLDLAVGKLRVKIGGGSGGHNGLKDIDVRLGKEYKRIRIGIGHPGDKDIVADYVLQKFSKTDKDIIKEVTLNIVEYIGLLLDGKKDLFMSRVATALQEGNA